MRLTRRGRVVGGIVVIGAGWGIIFGHQGLNAIILPGVVAILAGWLILHRAPPPEISRECPSSGFPGETREVRVEIEAPGALPMSVTDTIPDGVDTPNGATLTPDRSTYEAVSETRGVVQLGPCRIRRTDPFGLVKLDTIDSTAVTEFITFPSVHPLTAIPGQSHGSPRHVAARDRDEFERLREYEQGDPLRDVDWKSSAKRDCRPLIVTEFASPAPAGRVLIAAESDPDRVEEMAEATASLADHFLADGLAVGVSTRDQEVAIGSGDAHRLRILSALALTEGGRASQRVREAGTIVVQALEDREVLVLADGERTPFDQLRGTTVRSPTPASRLSAGVPDGGSRP